MTKQSLGIGMNITQGVGINLEYQHTDWHVLEKKKPKIKGIKL